MPDSALTCPRCGSRYKAGAFGGGCPHCLMQAAPSGSGFVRFGVLPAEEVNAVLLDYDVAELVGTGGMGAVYRAREVDLDREVALKLLSPEAGADPEFAERFAQEARVLGKLAHPNIVPVYGLGLANDGMAFYSMKLVRGRTLQEIIGKLSAQEAEALRTYSLPALLTIFRKVCDAMSFAHSQGIIHRDLKPANVMVGEFGEVLVMDWGLAKQMQNEDCRMKNGEAAGENLSSFSVHPLAFSATLAGSVLGTPQYMSPEQARGEDDLDARADIFSLGGILYSILTLRAPVEGSTLAEIMEKARSGTVIAPTQHSSTSSSVRKQNGIAPETKTPVPLPHLPGGRVPGALSAVVMKALARERAERYQTVAELSTDVESFQGGFATNAEKAGTWTQLKLLMRRHRLVTSLLALMLAGSVGFVIKVMASERRATKNEQQALREKEATRQALAHSQIALADAAALRLDSAGLRAALDACPADLRDSTWDYLAAKAAASLATPGINSHRAEFRRGGGGEFLVADARQPVVYALQPDTGKVLREMKVRFSGNKMLALGTGERELLVSARQTREFEILDCGTGASLTHRVLPGGGGLGRVALSGDGQRIFVIAEVPGHSPRLQCVARESGAILWEQKGWHIFWASRDGEWLLAMDPGAEKKSCVLQAATGAVVSTMEPGHAYLWDVRFSEDNDRLVAADYEGYATVWDRRSGRRLQSFRVCAGRLLAAGFTTNGTLITRGQETAEPSSRHLLQAWNVERVVSLEAMLGVATEGMSFALDPDTGRVCTDGPVTQLWQFPVQRHRLQIPLITPALQMAFSGRDLLVTQHSLLPAEIRRLGPGTSTPLSVPREAGAIFAASGDGARVLFSGGRPDQTRLALPHGESEIEWQTPPWKMVTRWVALDHSGESALANDMGALVRLFVPGRAEPLREMTFPGVIQWKQQAFADEGRRLLALGYTGQKGVRAADVIACWDRDTGALLHHIVSEAVILALAVSPDGRRFAWAGSDKSIHIHNAGDFREERRFRAHDAAINGLAWHPSQPVLASVSDDISLKLWNPDTGQFLTKALGISRSMLCVAFNESGGTLAAGTADPAVLVFDTDALLSGK